MTDEEYRQNIMNIMVQEFRIAFLYLLSESVIENNSKLLTEIDNLVQSRLTIHHFGHDIISLPTWSKSHSIPNIFVTSCDINTKHYFKPVFLPENATEFYRYHSDQKLKLSRIETTYTYENFTLASRINEYPILGHCIKELFWVFINDFDRWDYNNFSYMVSQEIKKLNLCHHFRRLPTISFSQLLALLPTDRNVPKQLRNFDNKSSELKKLSDISSYSEEFKNFITSMESFKILKSMYFRKNVGILV